MASVVLKITPKDYKSFVTAVEVYANPKSYGVITDKDYAYSIALVPRVVTQRPIIRYYPGDEDEFEKSKQFLEQKGYTIIHGYVQEVVA